MAARKFLVWRTVACAAIRGAGGKRGTAKAWSICGRREVWATKGHVEGLR